MSRDTDRIAMTGGAPPDGAVPPQGQPNPEGEWPYVGSVDVTSRGIAVHWRIPHYFLWLLAVLNTIVHGTFALQETILAWTLFLLWATLVKRPRMGRWEFHILTVISVAVAAVFVLAIRAKYRL